MRLLQRYMRCSCREDWLGRCAAVPLLQKIVERGLQECYGEIVGAQNRHEQVDERRTVVLALVDRPEDDAGKDGLNDGGDEKPDDEREDDNADGHGVLGGIVMHRGGFRNGAENELEGVFEHRKDDVENRHDNGDDRIRLVAHGVGRQAVFAAQFDEFAADLVEPVVEVKRAGEDRIEHGRAAVHRARLAREGVDLVRQLVHPVESVDAAGDDGQDDGERDVALLYLHENLLIKY